MTLLTARNPHEMLPIAVNHVLKCGVERPSRNGDVLQLPGPVLLQYTNPWERVVFWPERDANPFFHLYESLWMLAGKNDVASLTQYVARMASFSDDGIRFNAAYGNRWRRHFGVDQLAEIVEVLGRDKDSRRAVLGMWDPREDLLHQQSKDLPCNTHVYFALNHEGQLDMTVCNRSNDLVWGALGANCVHFSVLMEWIATELSVPLGRYYHFTNNLHIYKNTLSQVEVLPAQIGASCPYALEEVVTRPLGHLPLKQIETWLSGSAETPTAWFLHYIADPMHEAYMMRKTHGLEAAIEFCRSRVAASDWAAAGVAWLERRLKKQQRASDDGVSYEPNH
jgi:thymidylate synthase